MRDRLDRALFAGCAVVYLALATRISDGFGRVQFGNTAFSNFFDHQTEALLRGDLHLADGAIGLEAFVVDGEDQMYFGLFPSLLRLPIAAVTDAGFGRFTVASSFLAWLLFVAAAWALTDSALQRDAAETTPWLARAWKVGLALGTPMLMLAGPAWVFSEAIMWGVASCVWFQHRLVREIVDSSIRNQWWLAAALLLATLNRPTLGLGCLAVTGAVVAWRLVRRPAARTDQLRLAGIVVGAAAVFVGPNLARFGRLLGPPMELQGLSMFDAHRMRMLDYSGGDFVDPRYGPTNLLANFRPDGVSLSGRFPFIDAPTNIPTVIGGPIHDITYRTPSFAAAAPFLLIAAVAGGIVLLQRLRTRTLQPVDRALGLAAVAGAPAAAALVVWGFVAPRYLADFVPLAIPLGSVAVERLVRSSDDVRDREAPRPQLFQAGFAAMIGWSVLAAGALGVSMSYEVGYDGDVAEFLDLQGRGDVWADAERRPSVADFAFERDNPPPSGVVAVLGACEAAYYSTGEQVDPWLVVDYGPNDFRQEFTVSLDRAAGTDADGIWLGQLKAAELQGPDVADVFDVVLVVDAAAADSVIDSNDDAPLVSIELRDQFGPVVYPLDVERGATFDLTITSDPVRKVLTFDVDGVAVHYGHVFTRSLYTEAGQVTEFAKGTAEDGVTIEPIAPPEPC